MSTEESTGSQPTTAEPRPVGAGAQDRRRHRGRRGRFHRGGRGGRDNRPDRASRPDQESRPPGESHAEGETPVESSAPPPKEGRKPLSSSIHKAIEQILNIRAELRRILDEIQEVVRTLDQAEREKTASEDEIEMLRESLRGLHREPAYPRHRSSAPPKPAPAHVTAPEESAPPVEEQDAAEDTEE
jgi:hypothetical protein